MTRSGVSKLSNRSRNTLSCKHTTIFDDIPPKVGNLVWCAMCADYRVVENVELMGTKLPSWRWVCSGDHGSRKLEKSFPGQKLKCEKSAIAHAKRNRHTVVMYKPSGTVHHSFTGHDPNQLSLPVVPDGVSEEIGF